MTSLSNLETIAHQVSSPAAWSIVQIVCIYWVIAIKTHPSVQVSITVTIWIKESTPLLPHSTKRNPHCRMINWETNMEGLTRVIRILFNLPMSMQVQSSKRIRILKRYSPQIKSQYTTQAHSWTMIGDHKLASVPDQACHDQIGTRLKKVAKVSNNTWLLWITSNKCLSSERNCWAKVLNQKTLTWTRYFSCTSHICNREPW